MHVNELADMNVGLTEGNEREEENITIDATKLCHFAATSADVIPSFRHNLPYRRTKVNTHDA